MPEPGIIPTGYERTLPPEAQLLVRARRRALIGRARGRVLDLGGAESHAALWEGADVAGVVGLDGSDDPRLEDLGDERFDTVLSVFQLAASPSLDTLLGTLRQVLADDGRLLFLEPGRLVRLGGRVQRLVGPSLGGLTGWRADRDIPFALRQAGLSVTDVARHRVPTLQPWLRQVVEGSAHRALAPGGGRPDPS